MSVGVMKDYKLKLKEFKLLLYTCLFTINGESCCAHRAYGDPEYQFVQSSQFLQERFI
jgi:hypothetical protein